MPRTRACPEALLEDVAADVEVVFFQGRRPGPPSVRSYFKRRSGSTVTSYWWIYPPKELISLTPGNGLEKRRQDPILGGPQLGQPFHAPPPSSAGTAAFQRVLVDFPHGRGNRAHGDFDSPGDLFPGLDQALQDQLTGEIDVHSVLEDDGD